MLLACLPVQVIDLLEEHPHIILDEHHEGNDEITEEPEAGVETRVWGNMVAFLERLDDEHFKSLQVGLKLVLVLSTVSAVKGRADWQLHCQA